jgi:hypothetical protein
VSDFESLRIALMNTYNNQALTHAGYIIALVIALFTLVSSETIKDYYNQGKFKRFSVHFIFSSVTGFIIYFISKIVYWSWLGSETLTVTMENAASTQSITLVYGIQKVVMERFSGIPYLFINFTYGTFGFNYWSFFFYLLLPIMIFLGVFGLVEILVRLKNRRFKDFEYYC